MKSQAEKWLISQMWIHHREIMAINKRHEDKKGLPGDMPAHCIHRHAMEKLAHELAKERKQEYNPLIESVRILHTYCPWY